MWIENKVQYSVPNLSYNVERTAGSYSSILGLVNMGYDAATNITTFTWTVQGGQYLPGGLDEAYLDTFIFTDTSTNLQVVDKTCQSTITVVSKVPYLGGGEI